MKISVNWNKYLQPNSDGKSSVRKEHAKEKKLVTTAVDPVVTYFITLHKTITQLVEGCPSSDRLIVITSFSTSKLNKISEIAHGIKFKSPT